LNNKKKVIKLKTMNQNKVELNRIEEMMLQNIQSSNEQNVNSVEYTTIEAVLQMNLRGNSKEPA
jgi:hypothetical protein